jgi:hypothetical protein
MNLFMEILDVPDMLSNCPNNADHCCPTFISFLAKQSVPFPVLTIGSHCCLAMGVIVSQQFVPLLYSNAMLSGSTVTTAWRVLGLWIEETASRYGG